MCADIASHVTWVVILGGFKYTTRTYMGFYPISHISVYSPMLFQASLYFEQDSTLDVILRNNIWVWMSGADLSKLFGWLTGGRGLHTHHKCVVFHRFWMFYQCLGSIHSIIGGYSYMLPEAWVGIFLDVRQQHSIIACIYVELKVISCTFFKQNERASAYYIGSGSSRPF